MGGATTTNQFDLRRLDRGLDVEIGSHALPPQQRGLGVEPVHIHLRPQRPRCPSEVQFRRALRKFRLALTSVGGSGPTHAAATIDDGPLVAVAAANQMSF